MQKYGIKTNKSTFSYPPDIEGVLGHLPPGKWVLKTSYKTRKKVKIVVEISIKLESFAVVLEKEAAS